MIHDHDREDWTRWTFSTLVFHLSADHPDAATDNAGTGWPMNPAELHAWTHRLLCRDPSDGDTRKECGETATIVVDGRALCVHHGAAALNLSLG